MYRTLVGGILLFSRNAVGLFYSPSWQGQMVSWNTHYIYVYIYVGVRAHIKIRVFYHDLAKSYLFPVDNYFFNQDIWITCQWMRRWLNWPVSLLQMYAYMWHLRNLVCGTFWCSLLFLLKLINGFHALPFIERTFQPSDRILFTFVCSSVMNKPGL